MGYWADVRKNLLKDDKEAAIRFKSKYTCVICGKDDVTFTDVQKYAYFIKNNGQEEGNNVISKNMVVCGDECRKEYVLQGNIPAFYLMDGVEIPKRYANARIEYWDKPGNKVYTNALKWLNGPKTKGFYFQGPPGTGKTSLAVGLAYELRKREMSVKYQNASALACMANAFMTSEESVRFTNRFDRYDVVIIDDLAKHHLTNNAKELLFQIFANIYDSGKALIITSNYPQEEVSEAIDERLASRLKEITMIVGLVGADQRSNG